MIKEVKIDKMDELIEALGGGSIVPTPTAQDEGKVLTANDDGTASWENASGGVPDYSQALQGSVLATQYSGELGWDRPENLLPQGSLLPVITGNDNGKVLQAVYNDKSGAYVEWVTAPTIKSENFTKDDITYSDKSGEGTMYIPPNSVILTIRFVSGGSSAIYPVEYSTYSNSGNVVISSDEYQKITDDPTGQYIVYYF